MKTSAPHQDALFSFIAFLLGCLLLAPASTKAASFDCARATLAREKTICAIPELSALDDRLGQLYAERKARLSAKGKDMLATSQKSWLRFVSVICTATERTAALGEFWTPAKCLKSAYESRLEELEQVGVTLGPFMFTRIDAYKASPADDTTGSFPGSVTVHAAYPRIDAPDTPITRAWNARMVVTPASGDDDCDIDTDYHLNHASPRLISVTKSNFMYCHGAPHGYGGSAVLNIVLGSPLRDVTADDLLRPGWQAHLDDLAWRELQAQGWEPQDQTAKAAILDAVKTPSRWVFTPEGLSVSFNPYEGGCYICQPAPITLRWDALAPVLRVQP